MLAGLSTLSVPVDVPSVDAGFFHRTLARWLDLPEGRAPGSRASTAPLWSYAFWKAELRQHEPATPSARAVWRATVYTSAHAAPHEYAYWVELDARKRIRRCGWLSDAPNLLAEFDAFPTPTFTAQDYARVFDDVDG